MFGPGGYGKSDAAVLFHQYLKEEGVVDTIEPYVMAFGQGMTEEKLLGGLDIKKFQDDGELMYHLKNAFVSYDVVIFEELWDAFPAVLLILKDILQSRKVRMGNQIMDIKTKIVIACTNRSREEVVSDDSTEALMQRFLFEKEVKWTSHLYDDYIGAFKASGADTNDTIVKSVARICEETSKQGNDIIISPRTAGKALRSAQINGLESLNGMYGLTAALNTAMKKYSAEVEDDKQNKELMTYIEMIRLLVSAKESNSAMKNLIVMVKLSLLNEEVNKIRVRDACVNLMSSLKKALNLYRNEFHVKAINLINPKVVKGVLKQFYDDKGLTSTDKIKLEDGWRKQLESAAKGN